MKKIYFFLLIANVLLVGLCLCGRVFAGPEILSVNPVNGTTSVAINTRITVMFNEAMNSASIGSTTSSLGTFTVTYQSGGTQYVSGNIAVIDSVAKFTPTSNLNVSTLYTCTMATGTANLSGSSSSGLIWTFTTGSVSDTSNAGVWYTYPYNLSTGVAIATQYVYIIFNERQDPSKIGSSTVAISTNSVAVSGSLNYYDYSTDYVGTPTAVFTPSGNLNYSTTYTITTDGVFDLAGNQIGTNTSTFTTVSAPSSGEEPVKPAPLQVAEVRINPNLDKIRIKFNYSLNGDDLRIIETKDCSLKDPNGNESQFGSLELDNNVVILYLIEKMSQNTTYTLTIKGGNEGPVAAGAGGEVLAEDYILKFTTTGSGTTGKGIRHKEKKKQKSYSPIPPAPWTIKE